MNHRTRKQDEDRKLVWASLSTLAAGIVAVAAVAVAHAGNPYPAAAAEPDEALASLDPAALLAEAVEGRINAASPDEDSELHQGGPVITVIDLGDPAFGETASFRFTMASDGGSHQCEFLFRNGRGEMIRVDHPSWRVSLEQGRTRLGWRLEKTFHLTQFPPTRDNVNHFMVECDGRITDQVEFHLVAR